MNVGIYSISLNNEILYIGQSRNINRRWTFHKYELKNGIHKNVYLQRIYNKNNNIIFSIVEFVKDLSELTMREIYYIKNLKPKCNMTIPDKDDNWHMSVERNLKVSKALLGKKKTDQHRRNISAGRKGMKLNYDVWNKKHIEYDGAVDSVFGWETKLVIKQGTLSARLRRGWTVEKSIETPIRFLSEGRHKR